MIEFITLLIFAVLYIGTMRKPSYEIRLNVVEAPVLEDAEEFEDNSGIIEGLRDRIVSLLDDDHCNTKHLVSLLYELSEYTDTSDFLDEHPKIHERLFYNIV